MVERQFTGRHDFEAVLTSVAVAHKNVLARQGACLVRDAPVFQQADHGRDLNGAASGMHRMLRQFLSRCDALQHQDQRPPGRANVDRFVARIQHEYGFLEPGIGRHRFVFDLH